MENSLKLSLWISIYMALENEYKYKEDVQIKSNPSPKSQQTYSIDIQPRKHSTIKETQLVACKFRRQSKR